METVPSGDSRPAPSIPPLTAAPHLLLRVNPTAADALQSTGAAADRARLAELCELAAAQEQAAEKLTDLLYAVAGTCDRDVRQRIVLPLRRAIHNQRLPRRLSRTDIRAVVTEPAIETWLDNQERLERLRAELTEAHQERLSEERAALRAILADEGLRGSLAMSSELLPDAADKYRAAPWEQVKKNTRKSEESLLRYAMRACTKTSPFSRYTVAGFLPERPGDDAGIGRVASEMEFNRGVLRRLESKLSRLPAVRGAVRFHTSAGLRLEDGRFIAVGDRERLGPEAAEIAARHGEAKVTVPANPASIALVRWLRSRERGSATFAELADVIAERVPGANAAAAAAFVAKLCDFGVLVPEPIVDDHTPDALAALVAWLADFEADPTVAAVRAELQRVRETQDRFAAAGPGERVALLRAGKSACTAALEALGDDARAVLAAGPIWFEDGVLEPACGTASDWKPVLDDCRRLLDILQIFDEQHVFSRVLIHRFTDRYGPGGVCEDLDALGAMFLPAYDDALQITEGFDHELIAADPVLSRLVPLRAEIVSGLTERLLNPPPGADPAAPVELDPALAELVARRTPSWVAEHPASYGVFMQPLGGNPPTGAVLNKIYNGWGNYISRFLTHADEGVVDGVRRTIREHHTEGLTAELRPVQGFNANLHPLLAEADLDWDNGGAPDRLPLDRLVVRHDRSSDRVVLWDPVSDRRVHPLYLGFLIPYFLPSRLLPLTAMGGSGSIFFEPQVSADRETEVDRGRVRRYPGLRFGSVWLARARWHIPSESMPRPEPGEAESDFFVRLGAWRSRHGIPDHVFVHPPAPELSPGDVNGYFGAYMDNRKPQYVDLLSRLHVRHLDRLLAYQPGADIVVEEARPGPDEHFPVAGRLHAAEVVAEFYRKANPR
ncbi:lantibiotic dehydratase [Glycomyces tenuis]|uniref:lantibiotic dehydratase n=1 Tax=Glycomyces tenuis TaxID=58116 RepID=UPI00047CF0D9|nr:lantibiotic dehydratase [Glycomyces tenuis]